MVEFTNTNWQPNKEFEAPDVIKMYQYILAYWRCILNPVSRQFWTNRIKSFKNALVHRSKEGYADVTTADVLEAPATLAQYQTMSSEKPLCQCT